MAAIHLGIDCGTQSTKALALCTESARVLATARAPLELLPGLPPGHAEQRPEDWWEALRATVQRICAELGPRRTDIRGLAVAGQQHGFVALDAAGRVLRPAKLWCDTSTQAEAQELLAALGGLEGALACLGNGIPVGFTAPKVLWLKKHEPQNFARLATILLPHDYLNYRLCGELAAESGDASGTALFDVRQRDWSPPALAAIDADLASRMPRLVSPSEPLGPVLPEVAADLGLPPGVSVAPGGGDNMLGAIGTGNVTGGIVTASLGTSGTLYAYSDRPLVDPEGVLAAFCDSTGGWLPLACTLHCTTATENTRELLECDLATLERLAGECPAGNDGLVLLPYFDGERTPDLPEACGVLLGLRAATMDRAHLARAAYEGASLALGQGLRRLRSIGVEPREIRITGGGAASPLWRRILAAVFETPCVPLVADEGAALGAAIQAAWVTEGRADDRAGLEELCQRCVHLDETRRAEPEPTAAAVYRELLDLMARASDGLVGAFGDHRRFLLRRIPQQARGPR